MVKITGGPGIDPDGLPHVLQGDLIPLLPAARLDAGEPRRFAVGKQAVHIEDDCADHSSSTTE